MVPYSSVLFSVLNTEPRIKYSTSVCHLLIHEYVLSFCYLGGRVLGLGGTRVKDRYGFSFRKLQSSINHRIQTNRQKSLS